jgi:hypothetical protein
VNQLEAVVVLADLQQQAIELTGHLQQATTLTGRQLQLLAYL